MLFFWFAISISLFTLGFLAGNTPIPVQHSMAPSFFVVVFFIPLLSSLTTSLGVKRALRLILTLSVVAFILELFAVVTGYPYGSFHYGSEMGYILGGIVPWSVPLAWIPLLLGSAAIAHTSLRSKRYRVFLTVLLLLAADAVIDPGAVAMGFWTWNYPGWYYAIPFTNFVGWMCSSLLGYWIASRMIHETEWSPRLVSSFCLIVIFWTGVVVAKGMYGAAIPGIFCIAFAYRTAIFNTRTL